jgi:hypothetical protein
MMAEAERDTARREVSVLREQLKATPPRGICAARAVKGGATRNFERRDGRLTCRYMESAKGRVCVCI